mmetsp:Transcript_41306/g.104700  ORF Transcript_41306/g.104700 Transcript_41306/m.104700 type:complete len:131 (-) Transcript_41306:249-641(-)|eukprot:jgi/Tetstr1/460853/TSEL_006013.t1
MADASATTPAVFNVDVSPPVLAPEFEVEESDNSVDISGDVTGKANVRLGLLPKDRVLTIVGELITVAGTGEEEPKVVPYQRAVALPPTIDESAISAKLTEDGRLKLSLPKRGVETMHAQVVGACSSGILA